MTPTSPSDEGDDRLDRIERKLDRLAGQLDRIERKMGADRTAQRQLLKKIRRDAKQILDGTRELTKRAGRRAWISGLTVPVNIALTLWRWLFP